MGTKNNPSQFDCHSEADDDEPMFVLLARDKSAPMLVRLWADIRETYGSAQDTAKVDEANNVAEDMREWHYKNR